MKKYEELGKNLYVRQVGNLSTVYDASKLIGVSHQELMKFIVKEQISNNKIINDMLNKLFKYNTMPESHQDYYLNLLDGVKNLEYVVSVIDYNYPHLKKNPSLLFQTIIGYKLEDIKNLDIANNQNGSNDQNNYLTEYVTNFASDYGISSKKLYNFVVEVHKKNKNIFNRLMNIYSLSDYGDVANENKFMNKIKKIPNLEYIVAAIIYNFPGTTATTDTFMSALAESKESKVEEYDHREIEDRELKEFVDAKKEYSILETTK